MTKKKRKKRLRSKVKIFISLLVFSAVTGALGYNCFNNILQIHKMKEEKKDLENQLITLKEEKESLETDILKLEDPDYIAKYVREKYFYSKDGELILRLD